MSLLNYQVHYNPTSHKDVLSKFKAFALARGWAIDKYETSKDWLWDSGNSKYDWLAGNSDFLQIYSNGYGSQNLVFRFHWEGTGADAQSEWCYVTGVDPNERTPDDQSSTKPYLQDGYTGTYTNREGLPSGSHIALWLFGNDKFLIAVDQVSADIVLMWYTGTFELFHESMSTVALACVTQWNLPMRPWYEAKTYAQYFTSPWDNWHTTIAAQYRKYWWDGNKVGGERFRPNIAFTYQDNLRTGLAFNSLSRVVRANNFTGKRVLLKPVYFGKRHADDLWMPVGTLPVYRIESAGLQIGENVKYGSEEYLVFPNTFPSRKYGTAFRIV